MQFHSCSILLMTVVCIVIGATDTITVQVEHEGRKIQHDGFLMEWSLKNASVWGGDSTCRYDVMTTPEGLAGYFRLHCAGACGDGTLVFHTGSNETATFSFVSDSTIMEPFFRIDRSTFAADSTCTLEWLFPWPDRGNDTTASFSLIVQRECKGEPALPVLQFVYRSRHKNSGRTAGSLAGRIILIGALGALYLTVQAKIRSQSRRKESPRQSA